MALIRLNNNSLPYGVGGKVLQVVSTTKTGTFSTNSDTTYVDVTGLSVAITPSSTSSKIFIVANIALSSANSAWSGVRLRRNGVHIGGPDETGIGSRDPVNASVLQSNADNAYGIGYLPISYLDTPSSTSSVTYKIQINGRTSYGAGYINRSAIDNNDAFSGKRASSTITAYEIAG